MRRLLSFICCLTLCVLCVCPTVTAEVYPKYRTYGNFKYALYESGYAAVTNWLGSDEELVVPAIIEGYPVYYVNIDSQQKSPKKIVIEEGITSVQCLSWAENRVTEVELPQGLKNISYDAMKNLTELKTLTIPSSVLVIGQRAFPEGITLRGEADSYAARWAKVNGYAFETIIPPRSVGDVNGDNLVNSTDARLILQYFVNGIDEEGLEADFADIDQNGEVDSTDARLALQYFVGAEQPEAITAPAVKPFEGWIDPAKVKSVYAKLYDMRPYPGLLVREGEVDDPKATVDCLNQRISNSFLWSSTHSKDYPKWIVKITLYDGSVYSANNVTFTYGGTTYGWWGTNPPPFWND